MKMIIKMSLNVMMSELKKYLKETDLYFLKNYFILDEFFDLYSMETFKILKNERNILDVFIMFNDKEKKYTLSFNEKDSIIAYLICCFDVDYENKFKVNNKIIEIKPSIKNFNDFLEEIQENNLIESSILSNDVYIMIKNSVIYNTERNKSKNRSFGEALKIQSINLKC